MDGARVLHVRVGCRVKLLSQSLPLRDCITLLNELIDEKSTHKD